MSWSLQALNPELNAEIIHITQNSIVGRQQESELLIQAPDVSRRHAELQLQDGALWLQDLNSANGTYVNDLRIDAAKQLQDGDIVQFAHFKFKVLVPAANTTSTDQPNNEGIPSLSERDQSVLLGQDGMPQRVAVPKPAPIPTDAIANINTDAASVTQPKIQPIETSSDLAQRAAQDRNAKLGLWALFVLLIIALAIGFYVA